MKQRGRKTAGALMAVDAIRNMPRLPVPAEIQGEARAVWLQTVSAMPAEWFTGQHVFLLASYCRHVAAERRLARCVERLDIETISDLESLAFANRMFAMHARETNVMAMLATRMRLTQNSVVSDLMAGNRIERQVKSGRPWQDEDDQEAA